MGKTAYEVLISNFTDLLAPMIFEIVSSKYGEKALKNSEGKPTGEVEKFLKLEVEIPRGNGQLSKLRISIKIINGFEKFSPTDIIENGVFVQFENLEIIFIDNRKNVYFRATDYSIVENGGI